MAVRTIQKFLKPIQTNLLPALQEKIGLVLYKSPINNMATKATYSGEVDGVRTLLEFSSNHRELQQDLDRPVLFVNTYYGSGGNSAGVIDLNNIDEAVDQIYSALYELGFRSETDKAEDEAKRQEELRKQQEEKDAAEAKKRDYELRRKEELHKEQPKPEEEPEEIEDNESELSINEASIVFDKYLNAMTKDNLVNAQMIVSISYSSSERDFKILNINMFYISAKMCLVQTTNISPKIDKATSWQKAKDYIFKVAEKVNGVISIDATTEEGKDIDITDHEEENTTDVGIDI